MGEHLSWKVGDHVKVKEKVLGLEHYYGRVGTLSGFERGRVIVAFGMEFPRFEIDEVRNVTKGPKKLEDARPIGEQIASRQRASRSSKRSKRVL